MICERCGKVFDERKQDYCGFCRTVHDKSGKAIRDIKGILLYITERFGRDILSDRRRTDALIADLFPKETTARRLIYIAMYDGCVRRLSAAREKPFEVRCAAGAKCIKSLRDELGIKGRICTELVEAFGAALGCDVSFKKSEALPASATESKKNITDAAEQYSLGRHFDRIHDYEKALYWFELSALQDCGEAQYYMGCYRLEGRGGIQDVPKAREWFLRGAENGVAAAEYMSAYFLAEGIACEIDEKAAFERFLHAARLGDKDAMNVVALCYENGVHVAADSEQAKRWRKAIKRGVPTEPLTETEAPEPPSDDGEEHYQSARRCLAENDAVGAAMFYKRAAEEGHIRAMCSYGKCLFTGSGTAKDEGEAFRWFKKAADAGLDIAQYNLGIMYLKGAFVPKDTEKAVYWFSLAAENGHEEAANIIKKLK